MASRVASTNHSVPAVRRVITAFGAVRCGGVRGGRRLVLVEDSTAGGERAGGVPPLRVVAWMVRQFPNIQFERYVDDGAPRARLEVAM